MKNPEDMTEVEIEAEVVRHMSPDQRRGHELGKRLEAGTCRGCRDMHPPWPGACHCRCHKIVFDQMAREIRR
jgi:hypothetical protein